MEWMNYPGHMTFPEGQNVSEYASTMYESMCQLISGTQSSTIACVVHKTMGRLFVAKVIGLDLDAFRAIPMDNCGVTEFEWNTDGKLVLRRLNVQLCAITPDTSMWQSG